MFSSLLGCQQLDLGLAHREQIDTPDYLTKDNKEAAFHEEISDYLAYISLSNVPLIFCREITSPIS